MVTDSTCRRIRRLRSMRNGMISRRIRSMISQPPDRSAFGPAAGIHRSKVLKEGIHRSKALKEGIMAEVSPGTPGAGFYKQEFMTFLRYIPCFRVPLLCGSDPLSSSISLHGSLNSDFQLCLFLIYCFSAIMSVIRALHDPGRGTAIRLKCI